MKKTAILAALVIGTAALVTGCVPSSDSTTVEINPDFQTKQNIELDFVQLHNDTLDGLESIEDGQPFVFISNVDIDGDDKSKTVVIRATAVDGASEDDCKNFASALLCQLNDAAVSQNPAYEASSSESFGTFYDDYSIDLSVADENNDGTIYVLTVPAGDDIPLDPDYEKYVDEWLRDLEIYKENLVYDVNGNIARDGNQ